MDIDHYYISFIWPWSSFSLLVCGSVLSGVVFGRRFDGGPSVVDAEHLVARPGRRCHSSCWCSVSDDIIAAATAAAAAAGIQHANNVFVYTANARRRPRVLHRRLAHFHLSSCTHFTSSRLAGYFKFCIFYKDVCLLCILRMFVWLYVSLC